MDTAPIFDGTNGCYDTVVTYQARAYRRLGIYQMIADQCEVPLSEVGKSCQANHSLGRHSFLTALYWHATQTLKMTMTYARRQAGHAENTHTLEEDYVAFSSAAEGKRYCETQVEPGPPYDPLLTAWHQKNAAISRDKITGFYDSMTPDEKKEFYARRGRKVSAAYHAPENREARAKQLEKATAMSAIWYHSLSKEEQAAHMAKCHGAVQRKKDAMTPEEREKEYTERIKRIREGSSKRSPESRRLVAIKAAATRKANWEALPPETQAALKQQQKDLLNRIRPRRSNQTQA